MASDPLPLTKAGKPRGRSSSVTARPTALPAEVDAQLTRLAEIKEAARLSRIDSYRGVKHEPNDFTIELVRHWAEVGVAVEIIANELGIHTDTLQRHYGEHLSSGEQRGVARVAQVLYAKALAGDVTCILFYLKTKGRKTGWIEREPDDSARLSVTVQLNAVKAIQSAFTAMKRGESLASSMVIEHADPDNDGRDLL